MIAVGLACFLGGLMLGLYLQPHTKPPVYSGHYKDKTDDVTKPLTAIAKQKIPNHPQAFRLRRSFRETRAAWEDQHNQKAKRNASLAEQIRKAQEGTLQ